MRKKQLEVVEGDHRGAARKFFDPPPLPSPTPRLVFAETGQLFNLTQYDSTWRVLTQPGIHVWVHRGRVALTWRNRNALVRYQSDA